MRSAELTVWNLHLSVANQLTREEGLCVSVLNEFVLHHLNHAKSRLERSQGGKMKHFSPQKKSFKKQHIVFSSDVLLP